MKAEREKIHAKVKADTVRLNGSKLELTADEAMGTFLLVSEGSCTLQMGENDLLLNPGSALLLGAGDAVLTAAGAAVPELVGCRFPLSALHELRSATQRDFARLFLPGEVTVLSPYYLSRQFRRVTGQSIVDYLNNRRIEAAQKLLETTELSISAIAEQTGFASAAHFRRVFREVMDISPLQYRKKNRE